MEEGREKGSKLWSIVNVRGSMAHRISDGSILRQTGLEIGVVIIKTFTTALIDLLLKGYLAQQWGQITEEKVYRNIRRMPAR